MSFTVPTYIRSEDTDKYAAIISKGRGSWTEFIHDALNVDGKKPIRTQAAKQIKRIVPEGHKTFFK